MIQRGSGLRFALKPSQRLGILGEFFGQELQCDEAVKRGVLSLVDHTHPAAAELLDDVVVRDKLVDHGVVQIVGRTRGRVNVLRAKPVSLRHPIDLQEAPADQSTPQGQECLVNVRPLFVAHPQTPELVQPSEGPFDYPPPSAQSTAMLGVSLRKQRR